MSLTARKPTGADTAGFVPEIWSNQVIDEMQKNLVCWDSIDTNGWSTELRKGDTLHVGVTNHVTATEVVVGTKASSLDIATGTKKSLVIDQWFEAPVDVDYMTLRQSQLDWPSQVKTEAAYAIKVKVDTTVATLFSALNGGSVLGTDGQPLTDDLLLEIIQTLKEADVPQNPSEINAILDPSALVDMLKIDKFISAQYINQGAVTNGKIGTTPIYGCTVRVTNNLVAATKGAYAVVMHKKAIIGAIQMEPMWTKEYEDLHLRRYSAECLWGLLEVRDDFGIPFYTRHA
jgi:hypothetical protein